MNRNFRNNNNLINQFNNHNNKNQNMFSRNSMINQNPQVSQRDMHFYNKLQLAKLEKIKQAKNINDFGLSKKEVFEQIIDPIKINKTPKIEIDKDLNNRSSLYSIDKKDQANDYIRELWKTRTNQAYKNVIKKELFDKDYKKYYKEDIFKNNINNKSDLIVHKIVKNVDADEILLEAEFELLNSMLEKHNDELKSIYTVSNKNKFKKDFEYAQKYKYRLEYNPKDAEELKDFYKKEQKKINKENKMLDQIIDMLVEQDELSSTEVEELNNKLKEQQNKKEIDNKIDNEIEKTLREELGDDYDELINKLDNVEDKVNVQSIKITSKVIKKNKIGIKSSTIKKDDNIIDESNDETNNLKELYKNRKNKLT